MSAKKEMKKKAAALRYNMKSDDAPVVLASGQGRLAEKILNIAKENNIPIKNDQNIIDLLIKLNIGEEIPTELYKAVAEILSFIYRLEKE